MSTDSETIRSQLRLPGDLYEQIKDAASLSGRSMNAEIVHRLERSLKVDRQDAFEVLVAAQGELHELEKYRAELDEQILRAQKGDTSGIDWIVNAGAKSAPALDASQLIQAAELIRQGYDESILRAHQRMHAALGVIAKGKGMPHLD